MNALATNRKQRLHTLENDIRKNAESIQKNGLQIGRDLIEIRDEELWRDDYESWNDYLKLMAENLVGKSFSQAKTLIDAAVISTKIPERFLTSKTGIAISASSVAELRRLAPRTESGKNNEADYLKIEKADVKRVLESAIEIAGNDVPSVRDIRKAVDADLGIDRKKQAEERREQTAVATGKEGIDLADYLRQKIGQIRGITSNLENVPGEGWLQLERSNPRLATELAEACETLAELLRS